MIGWILAGIGAYALLSGSGGGAAPAQMAQQKASWQAAQQFDQLAATYGLTQTQANLAWGARMTPAQWLAATGAKAGDDSTNPHGTSAPTPTNPAATATITSEAATMHMTADEYAQSMGYADAADMSSQTGLAVAGFMSTSGPLHYYGEEAPEGSVFREPTTGAPVLVDDLGQEWTYAASY